MRKGVATPEVNNEPKLTIPVKTRTPLEAFKMLRAGQPIDQAAGYYANNGTLEPDFFMMDPIEKLHALARYREMEAEAKADMEEAQSAYNAAMAADKEARKKELLEQLNKLNNEEEIKRNPGSGNTGGELPK